MPVNTNVQQNMACEGGPKQNEKHNSGPAKTGSPVKSAWNKGTLCNDNWSKTQNTNKTKGSPKLLNKTKIENDAWNNENLNMFRRGVFTTRV